MAAERDRIKEQVKAALAEGETVAGVLKRWKRFGLTQRTAYRWKKEVDWEAGARAALPDDDAGEDWDDTEEDAPVEYTELHLRDDQRGRSLGLKGRARVDGDDGPSDRAVCVFCRRALGHRTRGNTITSYGDGKFIHTGPKPLDCLAKMGEVIRAGEREREGAGRRGEWQRDGAGWRKVTTKGLTPHARYTLANYRPRAFAMDAAIGESIAERGDGLAVDLSSSGDYIRQRYVTRTVDAGYILLTRIFPVDVWDDMTDEERYPWEFEDDE